MGLIKDIRCKIGACSFYEAEEYADRKRKKRDAKVAEEIYRVTLKLHDGSNYVKDIQARYHKDALHVVVCSNYDMKVYSVIEYEVNKKYAKINANAKVEKLTGKRITVHYYKVDVDTIENRNAQYERMREREDWERRAQCQNIV